MPKVSVIMPVYNCECFVEEAVESVTRQTERDFELIIINDGSTDGSPKLLERLASGDCRICLFSQANSGKPAVARNVGLSRATGEFIAFLDADDIYEDHKIERQLSEFESNPELDLVFSDMKVMGHDCTGEILQTYLGKVNFMGKAADYLEGAGENFYLCQPSFYDFMSMEITGVTTQTVMLRRRAIELEEEWFCEDLLVGEDIDFYFRLAKRFRVGFINEVLAYYRQRDGSLTHDDEKMMLGSIQAHTRNLKRGTDVFSKKEILKYKRRIAMEYFHLGYYYSRRRQKRRARGAYTQSMVLKPSCKALAAWFKTLFPNWGARLYRRIRTGGRWEDENGLASEFGTISDRTGD